MLNDYCFIKKKVLYIYDILCYEYLTLFVIFWSKININ